MTDTGSEDIKSTPDLIALAERKADQQDIPVPTALDVLTKALKAPALPGELISEMEGLYITLNSRLGNAKRETYRAGNLTNISGLCYQKDNSDLACSVYLFDNDYPVHDPYWAVYTSGEGTEESSHREYRDWFEQL